MNAGELKLGIVSAAAATAVAGTLYYQGEKAVVHGNHHSAWNSGPATAAFLAVPISGIAMAAASSLMKSSAPASGRLWAAGLGVLFGSAVAFSVGNAAAHNFGSFGRQ